MDAFSYVDIFDTKGVEYLIVIAFLILVIPFWIALNRPVKEKVKLQRSTGGLTKALQKIPAGIFVSANHTWAHLQRSGQARVGLDDFILHMTGGVSIQYLQKPGDMVKRGDPLAKLVQGDKSLQIASPVSGEISTLNSKLSEGEGLVNIDPYNKGWLTAIKPMDWKSEMDQFMLAEEAEEWSREELLKSKDFLAEALSGENSPVLQEGGELMDFPLADMNAEVWQKFQESFL